MRFYVGLHIPSKAYHFDYSFISVNVLSKRQSEFRVNNWIMDSGAFTEISTYGKYRNSVKSYAKEAKRWLKVGNLEAIVSQDYMCEKPILRKTGLTVKDHQRLTIERYDALMDCGLSKYVMPVLQGYEWSDYLRHLEMYQDRIKDGDLVGVGSVCKRNSDPISILTVLAPLNQEAPLLRLHAFGIKRTALQHSGIREMLFSADSMAWSFAARYEGRDQNSWEEAKRYENVVKEILNRPSRPWSKPIWLLPKKSS